MRSSVLEHGVPKSALVNETKQLAGQGSQSVAEQHRQFAPAQMIAQPAPENSFEIEAVASPAPSINPTMVVLAPSTDTINTGNKP